MSNIMLIVIGGVLVNNYVMSQFLGICPFLGVSKKVETAVGMGMAVTFVMGLAALFTYFIQAYVLVPLKLEYMQTIAFILVIATLVQIVEIALKKISPSLYQALGALGVNPVQGSEHIGITYATEEEAALLEVPEECPLFFLSGTSMNAEGRIIEYFKSVVRYDKVRFSSVLRRGT